MTFYQELQLNQVGSKALIRSMENRKDKIRHTGIYFFKIFLTMVFCVSFVTLYSMFFGNQNSIVGVVVLLCIMVFRYADFGIRTSHSLGVLGIIFLILAVGPRMANAGNLGTELLIHMISIFLLMVLGCHNVMMANQSTLVLGYLLLYGYDVQGEAYILRLAGLAVGAFMTGIVYYRGHRKVNYKRGWKNLIQEFSLSSSRTRWQLQVSLGVSSILFFVGLLGLPRAMWAGIAAMSVLLPFHQDLKDRVKRRIPGNLIGGILFLLLYPLVPEAWYPYVGILGGIGVGLSATYQWQAVFNSLGAMSVAAGFLGIQGAVFFRIFHNILGALYGQIFHRAFHISLEKTLGRRKACIE